MAPFVNKTALDALATIAGERTLIGRQEQLDALSDGVLEEWDRVFVLSDAATEADDDASERPSGLHAKIIGIEHGWEVTWFVGSANLTAAAFTGTNVEIMASVTGRKGRTKGAGIRAFEGAGFLNLCEPYRRVPVAEDRVVADAQALLEQARKRLCDADLQIVCEPEGADWSWTLQGDVVLPEGVDAAIWPISLEEERSRRFVPPVSWILPMSRLTAFVALRLRATTDGEVNDVRFTLKVAATGIPEGRVAQVLRSLIDSPERFLQFLRALLGGLEALVDWTGANGGGSQSWGEGLGGETLLEDLVRAASRDPSRLEPIRRLIEDLRATEEGCRIVPDDLFAIWRVVDQAVGGGAPR